jgi:hypothetical protein
MTVLERPNLAWSLFLIVLVIQIPQMSLLPSIDGALHLRTTLLLIVLISLLSKSVRKLLFISIPTLLVFARFNLLPNPENLFSA